MGRLLTTSPVLPTSTQAVTLGGVEFRARFTWRERTGSWYLDLYTSAGAPLALGRRLSPGWGPLLGLSVPDGPAGYLYVRGPEPYVRSQLGSAVRVCFYTAAEVGTPADTEDAIVVTIS